MPHCPSGRFSIVSVLFWCVISSFATEPSFAAKSGNISPPTATTPHTANSATVLGFISVFPSGPSAGAPTGLHDAHDDGEDRQQGRHEHDGEDAQVRFSPVDAVVQRPLHV